MSILNQSKNIIIVPDEELPRNPEEPINKNWKWADGKKPAAGEDGLIVYVTIDSFNKGLDGKPVAKVKHMPEELADIINGMPGLKSPYPVPSDPLAEDEELVVVGPGMWGVQKKSARVVDPVMAVLDRIESKIDSIINNL